MGTLWRAAALLAGLVGLTASAASMQPVCPVGLAPNPDNPGTCVSAPSPVNEASLQSREDVLQELMTRCSNGDDQSCTELGGIFLRGAIVERDPRRAESYLGRACKNGHADGCDVLATAYTSDPQLVDEKKAAATRARACKLRGDCKAQPPGEAPAAEEGDVLIGSGTCFAISDDGLVATAAHVVDGAQEIVVRFGEEELLPATVEAKSSAVDVAVLKVARKTKDFVRVVSDPPIALGDEIFTVGFPRPRDLGLEAKFTDGVVSSLAVGGEKSIMQISVPVHSGNSGGALVSEDGVLYGVVVAKLKALSGETTNNISYAVKSTFLAAILDAPYVHRAGKKVTRKDAIRATTAATCLVLTRIVGKSSATSSPSP